MDNINWQHLISSIAERGLTGRDIAKRIGMSETGLSDLRTGRKKQPLGMFAVRLVELERKTRRRK